MNERHKRQLQFKEVFENAHSFPIKQFVPITLFERIYTPRIKEQHAEYTVVEYTSPQDESYRYTVWLGIDEYENSKAKNKKVKQ